MIQLDERVPIGTYNATFYFFYWHDYFQIAYFNFTLEVIEKLAPSFKNWEPELDLI